MAECITTGSVRIKLDLRENYKLNQHRTKIADAIISIVDDNDNILEGRYYARIHLLAAGGYKWDFSYYDGKKATAPVWLMHVLRNIDKNIITSLFDGLTFRRALKKI